MAEPSYERKDVSLKAVLIFAASLVVAAVVIHWAVERFYVRLGRWYPPTIYGARQNPPSITPLPPQLQANPGAEMAELRKRDLELLNSYGWVDKNSGTIRIPIERALELSLKRAAQKQGVSP